MSTFNAGAIEASLTLGRSDWVRDLRKTKKEIADLERESITIGVDLDTDNAQVQMDNLELFLEDLDGKEYKPSVDLDTEKARAEIESLEALLDRLDEKHIDFTVTADSDRALVELDNLENLIDVLEQDDLVITVRVDADQAKLELIDLSVHMQRMSLAGIDIPVDIDGYARAISQLAILEAQIRVLSGQDIDIDVNIDRAALQGLLGSAGGDGSGGHLGLLRILIYALIALSPVLAVSMSSATAAVVAFSAAVAGAAGAALVLGMGLVGLVQRFKDTDPSEYTPAMQRFADAIDLVKDAWNGFLDQIETAGFDLMGQALELVAAVLPTLAPLFNEVAEAMSGVLDGIGSFVESSEYQEMLDFFGGFGVDMLESFLRIGGNLLRFFGRLFQAIEPFAREMMKGLEDVTAGWMEWADDLENNQSFQQFMDNASKYGPMVLDMLGSMIQAFMALGEALQPFAGPMLEGLTWLFDLIANAPTEVLTTIIGLLAGLWLGFNVIGPLIMGTIGMFSTLATVLGIGLGPLILIIAAIAALGFAIYQLWNENETFRTAVIDTWNMIYETIEPIVTAIVDLFMENWPAIKEFFIQLWGDLKVIITEAMIIIREVVASVTGKIRAIWSIFGSNIMESARIAFTHLGNIIRGAFNIIKGIFQVVSGILTGDWQKVWTGIQNITRGAVGIVKSTISSIKDTVVNMVSAVRNGFNGLIGFFRGIPGRVSSAVSGMWDGIWSGFRNIINKVIGAWNNISFSVDIPDKIPGLPDEFRVSTPNVPMLARGAYLTEPTLNVAGEAGPEIVAPEPVLERIVRENSGGNFDYGRLAAAIASALASVMDRMGGLSRADLERIIESIVPSVQIDARTEGATVSQLAGAIGFQLRLMGYGGVDNV